MPGSDWTNELRSPDMGRRAAIACAAIERDVVIVACAISAGIHAALTPEHLRESTGAGFGFGLSVLLLAALVVALTRRADLLALAGAAAVFAGLLAAYGLTVTTGLPLLHPEVEPIAGLALVTKAVEAVGLLAAVHLLARAHAPVPFTNPRPRGTPA